MKNKDSYDKDFSHVQVSALLFPATSVKTKNSGLALKDVSKHLWVCSGLLSPGSRAGSSYLWGSCRGKARPALLRAVQRGLVLMPRHTV